MQEADASNSAVAFGLLAGFFFFKAYACGYAFYNNSEASENGIVGTEKCAALLRKG